MYPDIEVVRSYAKEYKRVPVSMELYADSYTTIEILRILKNASGHCYLLESASQDEQWGRYSFLGFQPKKEITCLNHVLKIKDLESGTLDTKYVEHPSGDLRKLLEEYKSPQIEGLPPFTGGLVGFFSYDYIKYSEPKLSLKHPAEFNDMDLMLFDSVICFDHYKQKLILITGCSTSDIEHSYEEARHTLLSIKNLLKNGKKKNFEPLFLQSRITPELPKESFIGIVEKAKHYIHEGDIFQVVLSNPLRAKAKGSLLDTFRVLRASNPSPYMFYFSSDDIELTGASPETLVKLDKKKLFTFPLAGTSPRGQTKEEDKRNEKALLSDEKERAEHNMLVDLGRNDIGKISKIGSVSVEKYMNIERFSQVMHIGSTVTGTIRDDQDAMDAIDSILPAGTLSGAPKFRACEIIEELETSQRGIYGGAIGYIDFTGNLDTCIAIRLVYKKNDAICIRTGAGIVSDSQGQKEYLECQHKAKAVVKAIKEAQEGLE
ncbi:chorismate-binding protein [uncultured Catenibacterium sp.]|uniref:anthranilate synthase component I family protein n=1 Tax=uncultured Catenibacterium sp. TaxID=286142 RepID=UPI0025FE861A|nr:chorismate-binding protein [uncultured Catenibacterium sp.]